MLLDKQSFFITQAPKGHVKDIEGHVQNLGQKSIDLYRYILERYTSPHGLVVELFAGTATMNRAAMTARRSCISIEMLPAEFEVANQLILKHRDNLLGQFKDKQITVPPIQRPLVVFNYQAQVTQFVKDLQNQELEVAADKKAKAKEEASKEKAANKEKGANKKKKSSMLTFTTTCNINIVLLC